MLDLLSRIICIGVLITLCLAGHAVSAAGEDMPDFPWGGMGFDPILKSKGGNLSSRYTAKMTDNENGSIVIWIDVPEAQIGQISAELRSEGHEAVAARNCQKAMQHRTAPEACSFSRTALSSLSGQGSIVIKDTDGEILLEEGVNLTRLKAWQENIIAARQKKQAEARQENARQQKTEQEEKKKNTAKEQARIKEEQKKASAPKPVPIQKPKPRRVNPDAVRQSDVHIIDPL